MAPALAKEIRACDALAGQGPKEQIGRRGDRCYARLVAEQAQKTNSSSRQKRSATTSAKRDTATQTMYVNEELAPSAMLLLFAHVGDSKPGSYVVVMRYTWSSAALHGSLCGASRPIG